MSKIKGSALLSSVFVLTTCLLFLKMFTANLQTIIENEQMIIAYLKNN